VLEAKSAWVKMRTRFQISAKPVRSNLPINGDFFRAQVDELSELTVETWRNGLAGEGFLPIKGGYIGWNVCQKCLIEAFAKVNLYFLQMRILVAIEIIPGTSLLLLANDISFQKKDSERE
jgi:hypothetical protein